MPKNIYCPVVATTVNWTEAWPSHGIDGGKPLFCWERSAGQICRRVLLQRNKCVCTKWGWTQTERMCKFLCTMSSCICSFKRRAPYSWSPNSIARLPLNVSKNILGGKTFNWCQMHRTKFTNCHITCSFSIYGQKFGVIFRLLSTLSAYHLMQLINAERNQFWLRL